MELTTCMTSIYFNRIQSERVLINLNFYFVTRTRYLFRQVCTGEWSFTVRSFSRK